MSAVADRAQKRFYVDVPFSKAVKTTSGDIEIKGYASTWGEDRDGESVDPKAFDSTLEPYMTKNPMLLYQHNQDWPLGAVTAASVDDKGLAIKAVIPKPDPNESGWRVTAYNLIKRGVIRTLSIGGLFDRAVMLPMDETQAPQVVIKNVDLLEISVVAIPANPDSLYSAAVKSMDGSAVGPMVTARARNQMSELIGMRELADVELLSMTDDERTERFKALCRLYERAGLVPPQRDSWLAIQDKLTGDVSPQAKLALTLQPLLMTMGFVKRGRAISAGNEERLRAALSSIQDVLHAIGEGPAPDEPKAQAPTMPQHNYIGNGGPCQYTIPAEGSDTGYEPPLGTLSATDKAAMCGKPAGDPIHVGSGAMTVTTSQTLDFDSVDEKALLPLGDRAAGWDAGAADGRVRKWAGAEDAPNAKYARAFFYVDGDKSKFGSYHLPFADVVGGTLTAIPRGVFAAAGAVGGARDAGPYPDSVKSKIASYYSAMRSKFNDDALVPPWQKSIDPDYAQSLADLGRAISELSGRVDGLKTAPPALPAPAPIQMPAQLQPIVVSPPHVHVTMPEMKVGGPEIEIGSPEIKMPDIRTEIHTPDVNVHPPEVKVEMGDTHLDVQPADVRVELKPADVSFHQPPKKSLRVIRDDNGRVVGAEQIEDE